MLQTRPILQSIWLPVLVSPLLLVLACDSGTGPPTPDQVAVSPGSATVTALGDTQQFSARVLTKKGKEIPGASVSWNSSAQKVASVNGFGLATAVGPGSASITATADGVSGTAQLSVQQIPATVTVSPLEATIEEIGQTKQFDAQVLDSNNNIVLGVTISWTSGAPDIATVSSSGLVTGKSRGEGTVFASSGAAQGSASVHVLDPRPDPPSSLSAVAVSSTQIDLSWQDNSSDELGFSIAGRTSGSGDWIQIGATDPNLETFSHTGLFPGSHFEYRVQAIGEGCVSEFSTPTTASSLAVILVTIGQGVSLAGLNEGINELVPGSIIPYSISASDGFEDPSGLFDDESFPASGEIQATTQHTFLVSADRSLDPILVNQTRSELESFWNAPNLDAAFPDLIEALRNLRETSSSDEAGSIVWEASKSIAIPSEALEGLKGAHFVSGGGPNGLGPMVGLQKDPYSLPINVLFVNGVWNTFDQAVLSSLELGKIIEQAEIEDTETTVFYNYSSIQGMEKCLLDLTPRTVLLGPVGWVEHAMDCGLQYVFDDPVEALGQIANLSAGGGGTPAEDAVLLAGYVRGLVEVGQKVILVGHSQGNLMIQEALWASGVILPDHMAQIGYLALASPLLSASPMIGAFDEILIKHEAMELGTQLGLAVFNIATPFWTTLAWEADNEIEDAFESCVTPWLATGATGVGCAEWGFELLRWGIRLHGLNESYYNAEKSPESRGEIAEAIERMVAVLNPQQDPPIITTTALPNATSGNAYSATLSAIGGDGTYDWSIISGSLPSGLALSASGAISGVPDSGTTGSWGITFQVSSSGLTSSKTLVLTIQDGGATSGIGFGPEQFALIPAGSFQMGSTNGASDEKPVHTVNITTAFRIQKTEVTQGQWRAVMGANPSSHSSCGDTCPVERVSWNDVQGFLSALNAMDPGKNYRLPTEAEWEYAARAGTTGDFGGTGNALEMGWYSENAGGKTHPVAEKQANAWGLFDMHGNVFEWGSDWYGPYPATTVTDPTGPATGTYRVDRGNSYYYNSTFARSAARSYGNPSLKFINGGFRLVRNP